MSAVAMSADARDTFDELAAASAGGVADYSGVTYARLDAGEALYWPVPGADHPGTPRVFLDRFATPDGLARMIPVDHTGPAEDVGVDAPIYLTTGRVLTQYQSGAQTRRVASLTSAAPGAYVEMNPMLAERYGIADGDRVELTSARGTVVAPAQLSTDIRPDTVFMPFHWGGEGSANRVTNDVTDPISGMPEYKVCAVSLARVEEVMA
jgi:assimilatory nitrate reductase catalytic subunit